MSYLPCELHCHTLHSDGSFKTEELLNAARADHLSLIALTDHNTFSGHGELDDTIVPAVRGIEWTTYFGHMLVLGAKEFVDWRDAVPDNIDEKISQVKTAGGLVGIAHPFQHGSPICTGGRWEFNVQNWNAVDYIEIWHQNFIDNTENDRAVEMWTALLDRGYKIAATYGRDWHRPEKGGHYGCTYIDFNGDVNEQQALLSIKKGRTVVSTGAKFLFCIHKDASTYSIGDCVTAGNADFSFFTDIHSRERNWGSEEVKYTVIKIVTNGGKTALETEYNKRSASLMLEKGCWYRAELWGTVDGRDKPLAITSPVYCG